jgi:hypothetical protein
MNVQVRVIKELLRSKKRRGSRCPLCDKLIEVGYHMEGIDLPYILMMCPAETLCKSGDVSIDDDPFYNAECIDSSIAPNACSDAFCSSFSPLMPVILSRS